MKLFHRPKSLSYVIIVVVLLCLVAAGVVLYNVYRQELELFAGQGETIIADTNTPNLSPTTTHSQPATINYETLFLAAELPSAIDHSKLRVVVATGDIIPARGVDAQIRNKGVDFPFAGAGVVDILKEADIAVTNLEAPILQNCPVHNVGFTFCGQARFAEAMARAGIDIASLENNHIGNYGQAGIAETISHLDSAGILWSSKSKLAIFDSRGMKFGLLSFNGISSQGILEQGAIEAIKQADSEVEVLMVSVHWGKEYELVPASSPGIAPENPLDISQLLIDAGADLVIGNHPHWVQGVELYKDKLITYGHGNFIFDQSWSLETSQGVIGRYTYYDDRLVKVDYVPVQIANQAQPQLAQGQAKMDILARLKESTELIRQLRQK